MTFPPSIWMEAGRRLPDGREQWHVPGLGWRDAPPSPFFVEEAREQPVGTAEARVRRTKLETHRNPRPRILGAQMMACDGYTALSVDVWWVGITVPLDRRPF